MSTASLRCLPLFGALWAAACHTPPAVPQVVGGREFTVGYRGEVVALGAAEQFPDPVAAMATADDARLVTVRTTLLELRADIARQFVPALLADNSEALAPQAVEVPPATPPAAAPSSAPGRLQPRRIESSSSGVLRPTAGPRDPKDPKPLATLRGVHADPKALKTALTRLLRDGHARLIGEPEVSCAEGTEAAVSCVDQTALVQRIDLVRNGNSDMAFDLAVASAQHGTWLQLAPHRTTDGGLQLGIRLQLRELVLPVPVAQTRFGRIHVPAVAIQDLRALENVSPQDSLILGTMSGMEPGMVVLAIVEVTANPTGKTGTWILP